ncbi:hypothetical protein BH09VER1_BH09VER1_55750 [soil metagenome]
MTARPISSEFAVSANWLAYSDSLKSEDIVAGLRDCVCDMAEDGIRMVELPIAHLDSEINELGEEFWALLRKPFDESDIAVASVHGPIFSFDRYSLSEEIHRLKRYARAAALLGARALVVHPVYHANLHVCSIARQALDRDIQLASAVCDELAGTCCRLAIENVPHNSWAYLRELFKNLPPAAGMCFDTGHYQVRPEWAIAAALGHFADRIACWHLSDNEGLCDAHLPPGQGVFDWPGWKMASQSIQAPRVIELSHPVRWEDPEARAITRQSLKSATAGTRELLLR